ncbi:MAG: class I SAM-dependent methyltransferase [Clostridiaceae bacterium]
MNYLDEIANRYTTLKGMEYYTVEYQYKTIKKYFIGDSALELGCADGAMTYLLLKDFRFLTVVDGSEVAIKRLMDNIKNENLTTIVGFFENIELDKEYDIILMGHILEHVENPSYILSKYKNYLKKDGRILITVPNAKSFHRLAAVKMGILDSEYSLNDSDINHGHKRVYDYEKLKCDIEKSGLKIEKRDGYMIKFLSNKQIEENWNNELITTYMEMGSEFVENAAEITVVCKK